ncbi:MAG: hypothetical protein R3D55_11075 [Chloroflexota bacterium]
MGGERPLSPSLRRISQPKIVNKLTILYNPPCKIRFKPAQRLRFCVNHDKPVRLFSASLNDLLSPECVRNKEKIDPMLPSVNVDAMVAF